MPQMFVINLIAFSVMFCCLPCYRGNFQHVDDERRREKRTSESFWNCGFIPRFKNFKVRRNNKKLLSQFWTFLNRQRKQEKPCNNGNSFDWKVKMWRERLWFLFEVSMIMFVTKLFSDSMSLQKLLGMFKLTFLYFDRFTRQTYNILRPSKVEQLQKLVWDFNYKAFTLAEGQLWMEEDNWS